jgi:dephospho-CoA kinase
VAVPKVIAITGNIGAGKSLVGDLLKKRGFTVIDTDDVVHELFETSPEMRQAIVARFGSTAMDGGEVDRTKLATLVFEDSAARKDLERIVHPAVLNACDRMLDQLSPESIVFMLVPLLFEAGLEQRYTEVWTVTTNEQILRERLRKRSGLTDDQINKRLAVQLPQQEKARRSHKVINNSGTVAETTQQLDTILQQLKID